MLRGCVLLCKSQQCGFSYDHIPSITALSFRLVPERCTLHYVLREIFFLLIANNLYAFLHDKSNMVFVLQIFYYSFDNINITKRNKNNKKLKRFFLCLSCYHTTVTKIASCSTICLTVEHIYWPFFQIYARVHAWRVVVNRLPSSERYNGQCNTTVS